MADIGRKFVVKFGLDEAPPPERLQSWKRAVRQYIENGFGSEQAGQLAAKAFFPDYGACMYASEAESTETLLHLADRE